MAQKFANAARGELAFGISGVATSLSIVGGGSAFPVADTGAAEFSDAKAWFKLVLQDAAGIEIVYVRTHASGSGTFSDLVRGQEGTAARAFAVPTVVGLRTTATDADGWTAGGGVKYDFTQSADFTAQANKAYWLAGDYIVTLPDSSSLPLGTTVRFMKALTATPTIQVGAGAAVIQTAKGSDTSVTFDVNAELVFVFNGTDWEV